MILDNWRRVPDPNCPEAWTIWSTFSPKASAIMNGVQTLKRVGGISLDVLEIYIPTLSFTIMFAVFVLQVFYRYFLNDPLTWPPEIISMTFIWTTVLGACYAQRKFEHVAFSVVYDRLSAMGQLIFRLLGNGFIAVAFILALGPVYNYISFMDFQKTTVLEISYSIVFAPFLIFMLLIIGRMLHAIGVDIGILFGHGELVKEAGMEPTVMAEQIVEDTTHGA